MRTRSLLAISGGVVCISGIALLGSSLSIIQQEIDARARDEKDVRHAAGRCQHALKEAVAPTRTPAVGESSIIRLIFVNPTPADCQVIAVINAAGFSKDPEGPQRYALNTGINRRYWTVSAKEPGDHEIVVSSGDVSITLGMHILANQFLSQSTTLIISAVLSILGPMATIPWWIELYRKNKQEKIDKRLITSQ
jgi:hypothetical protein